MHGGTGWVGGDGTQKGQRPPRGEQALPLCVSVQADCMPNLCEGGYALAGWVVRPLLLVLNKTDVACETLDASSP